MGLNKQVFSTPDVRINQQKGNRLRIRRYRDPVSSPQFAVFGPFWGYAGRIV
jgi:hypothetical protein